MQTIEAQDQRNGTIARAASRDAFIDDGELLFEIRLRRFLADPSVARAPRVMTKR